MRRRTLARAVISIIVGFAATVAISTAISLRVLPRGTPTTRVTFDWDHPFTSGWLMRVDHTGAGWTRRAASLVAPNTYGVAGHGNGTSITLAITPPGDDNPRPTAAADPDFPTYVPAAAGWADLKPAVAERLATNKTPAGTLLCWPFQMRTGWPLRAMAYWNDGFYGWGEFGWNRAATNVRIVQGREIGKAAMPLQERVVPLQPLWGGLIGNTFLYAGLIFFAATTASNRRAARRRRRGRCVACGYDLAGLAACPECGVAA